MATVIEDRDVEQEFIRERRAQGLDRWDEVWEGTYIVMPLPNPQHQQLIQRLSRVLAEVVEDPALGSVFPGCNVSDRNQGWKANFRCPDVAVYLNDNPARRRPAHWEGGPDFAIEIVSPGDRSREKLDFYAAVGTRELLIVDRDPLRLELYRQEGPSMPEVEPSAAGLSLETLPLTWTIGADSHANPEIRIAHQSDSRAWTVSLPV